MSKPPSSGGDSDLGTDERPTFAPDGPPASGVDTGRIVLAQAQSLRLGPLRVEPALRRILHEDGREEIAEPRVMQVLVALIQAGGQILSRSDLMMSCWHGVVVGEDAVDRVIGRVRRLAEGLGAGVFKLETITKVGYRLVATGPGFEIGPQPSEAPAPAGPSICVLPFANMSDDPQQEYFSDGITEDVITDLSKVSALFVTARTTAFALRGQAIDVPSIARQLNVGHVLEGSVRKAAGRVRITAQLIDGATGGHVWAERYDRDLKDIFALQDEISQAIVAALKLQLLPEEKETIERRGTTDAEAYTLLLMARRRYIKDHDGDLRGLKAIERLCRRAVEIDPGYANAWALLAAAQTALYFYHGCLDEDGLATAERALSLDANLAAAHAVKGRHLWQRGRETEARREIEAALALDPQSWEANSEAGRLNYLLGRPRDAIGYFEKAVTLMETANYDGAMLISCYGEVGDAEAMRGAAQMTLSRSEKVLEYNPSNGAALSYGAFALAALGDGERARDWIGHARLIAADDWNMRYNFACTASLHLKDADLALALLDEVLTSSTVSYVRCAELDRDLDTVRDDPRFEAMLQAARTRGAAANLTR
ncbi:winged helix-turn-helix domain-containing protein [Phenylobacterium sp.]|uniref:winged helix-turn-helix domain-containing protein n=1 Tax=Phenylobacterium sp. TaxID=1871053 RepID=UPI0035635C16